MGRLKSGIEIPLPGAVLRYFPHYVSNPDVLYCSLRDGVDWQQPRVKVFGKWHPTPRLVSFVGDDGISYRYSGQRHRAQAWPAALLGLRQQLHSEIGLFFNCALLNYYRDGRDCMGWHSDDEAELGADPSIASLSLGSARDFRLRPFPGRDYASSSSHTLSLGSGSLLLMLPPTQRYWQHSLPRRAHSKSRINITFRHIVY